MHLGYYLRNDSHPVVKFKSQKFIRLLNVLSNSFSFLFASISLRQNGWIIAWSTQYCWSERQWKKGRERKRQSKIACTVNRQLNLTTSKNLRRSNKKYRFKPNGDWCSKIGFSVTQTICTGFLPFYASHRQCRCKLISMESDIRHSAFV